MRPGYTVEVSGRRLSRPQRNRIVDAVGATLRREGCRRAAVSVAIVDDTTIAALHERFLAIPGPTDVLSFDLRDDAGPAGAAGDHDIEGEVVVSRDTARREAKKRRLPTEEELLRYVIHGTLHLLGYLDDKPERAKKMHRGEDEVLRALRETRATKRTAPSASRRRGGAT